jgi:Fungal specific transcription factor domain
MHHYTQHTAKTVGELSIPEDKDQSVWTDYVTDLAFENDLVLHGLLSLSALHLALCGISKRKHTLLAIQYHDMGLSLFRPYLSNITEHNYDAMFAFNCMVMLYAFGIQRCSESTTNTIAKIHQILTLFSNAKSVTKSHIETLRSSRWSVLMLPEPFPSADQRLPDEIEMMLAKLIQCVTATTASQAATYISTIQSLRYVLILMSTKRPGQVTLVIFTVMVPPQYWDMVKDRDPLALAILANYAVTLHWLTDNIWLEGWGKETVDAVCEALSPEWHDCISWAVGETQKARNAP